MIKASGTTAKLDLTLDGTFLMSLHEPGMSFELGGKTFTLTRKGVWGPVYELWLDKNLVASLKQVPLFNQYTLTWSDQIWQWKAIGLTAKKFGLYRDDKEVGTISPGSLLSPCKDITIDLPAELPAEVQAFLLWSNWRKWGDPS